MIFKMLSVSLCTSGVLFLNLFLISIAPVKTQDLRQNFLNFHDLIEEETAVSSPPMDYNITKLDIKEDVTRSWTISPFPSNHPKWFSYYINTQQFISDSGNDTSCASVFVNATSELSEVNGIWAACQDPDLPNNCRGYSGGLACHPLLVYKDGQAQVRIRTVKINFALYGLAILRFWVGYSLEPTTMQCFDYSARRDPFSPCEFRESKPAPEVKGGFQEAIFMLDTHTDTFGGFQIDMIARFKQDMVLLDKVEAAEQRLCDYGGCTTLPTTKSPLTSTSPINTQSTTTTTTTLVPVTDPETEEPGKTENPKKSVAAYPFVMNYILIFFVIILASL